MLPTIGIRIKSSIPSGPIAKEEIIACDINCPVMEVRWTKSLSNHDARTATFLTRKSCVVTSVITFGPIVSAQSNNWY